MPEKIMVTRSAMPALEEYIDEIRELWDTHWLTNMGAKHEELRGKLADYLGLPGIESLQLFTNGHMAIELSLRALGLPHGSEVITTPFTFASTVHAIVRNGLMPVFCDIRPDDFTIDPDRLEGLITERTSAILPVHVYGNVCAVERIEEIAKRHGLKVLYDAAHAFGVTYKGKGIASYGDIACFSFHATKVFNTIEGGAAAYCDEAVGQKLFYLKNFGIRDAETVCDVGANAKMNEFCAAMGICNLRHVAEDIDKRRTIAEYYLSRLEGVPGIQLNAIQDGIVPNYAYFPVIIDESIFGADRDQVFEVLKNNDIYARKYFYPLASDYDCYRDRYDSTATPVARRISRSVLTLPIYPELSLESTERICGAVLSCRA